MSKGQPVRVKTPLGEDLLFKSMDLTEELGRLFHCELELYSPKEDIELDQVLAHDMTVEIDLPKGGERYVHGFVSEMTQTGRAGDYFTYSAVLRPWFWFLTRTADCRIFQQMKVPDIIKEVFRDCGFSDFKESLSAEYRTWEYCVQYRETDFNFVSRLMEQEGIYYFFEHDDGKDLLVLSDSAGAHSPISGYEKIPYYPPSANVVREEHVSDWTITKSVRTGTYGLSAFHFKKPRANLEAYSSIKASHPHADYEFFDYPGEHYEKSEGDRYAGVRIEEVASQHERVRGQTDARGLFPGGLFDLTEYPRKDQNREYLVVATHHSLSIGGYESRADAGEVEYSCGFEAMPSQATYRAERTTPKPVVPGPQTASVVGASGEEIDTDEYGRVKVQFHWDRYGKSDENSSCWVRVAQVWAGSQWGGMTIPRIGQEVIVDFIEGDPDRPIVTGRVYNADNMPPYELPANKTQSGIKSRSSKGGSPDNFNEIRFEDKKDEEEMYIHAEKDQNVVVENNQTIKVGFEDEEPGDRTIGVNNDESITIGRDRSLTVGRDKTEEVARNKSIDVGKDHSEGVKGNMTIMVARNLTETVAINYAETVGAAMELTVGAALTQTVGLNASQTVGGSKDVSVGKAMVVEVGDNLSEKVGDSKSLEITKDYKAKIGGEHQATVAKDYMIKAKKVLITAEDELSIKVGKAQLVLKKSGDVSLEGKKINVKGSGDVIVKGSNVKEN